MNMWICFWIVIYLDVYLNFPHDNRFSKYLSVNSIIFYKELSAVE